MRRLENLSVLGLFLCALILSACVQSKTPLLADMSPSTPLPTAFVLASLDGEPDAESFERKGDAYLEAGGKNTYRLYRLDDLNGTTGPFYVGAETTDQDEGASYGLIELADGALVMHSFETEAIAADLGLTADEFGVEVETDDQLLGVFRRVAADAIKGLTSTSRFKVLDLADTAERAEAERLLEETRKAKEAQ